MLDLCHWTVLACHLLAVNCGAAGPLICTWLCLRRYRYSDSLAGAVGRRLAKVSIAATSVGVLLGPVLLGLLWQMDDHRYYTALARLPSSKVWYALVELGFYYFCMFLYLRLGDRLNDHPIWHGWLAVLAATNLLYHFPVLMVIISSIARRPDLGGVVVDRAQFRALLVDPGVVSRVTHSWLAAVAVAGMALTVCGMCAGADATDGAGSRRVMAWGARIALVATLLQIGVGLWVLLLLPPPWRGALMGGSAVGCALLIAGLVTTVALMHHLIAVALGNTARRVVVRCMLLMLLVVVLMVGTLRKASGISAVGDTGRPTIGKGTHHATRGACSQRQSGDGENPARIRIQPLQLPVPA